PCSRTNTNDSRIEECLSRFRGRRRVQGELTRYFNEYLFLGGIESGQRAFQGIDPRDYAKASAEEKQQLGGVFGAIGENPRFYNPGRPENWSVDFSAVVAGYLSEGVPRLTWLKPKAEIEMQRAVEVVANFLRYLLQHDVCNEYKDDITNALVLCERAKEELPLIKNAIAKTPCRFNDATTRVFEGGKEFEYTQAHMRKEPMTADEGIFSLGMVFFGPRDVYEQLKTLKIVRAVGREEPCTLEILSVHPVDDNARGAGKIYGKVSKVGDGVATGIIRCKHIFIRDDLCHGDAPEETPPDRVEELMVDEGLLEFLRPGCIICVSLAELNIGLKYMVNLPEILPSFHRFLPQRMMRAYKPPRRNERPAPSALDPAGEEDQDAEE
ncbi:hypothetical protein IMZ48_49525, partial [Candidatus Bathyarchaeota archaeon]|nr:hypothetical protein [Candidatus Bathyarchaeota archaeon]